MRFNISLSAFLAAFVGAFLCVSAEAQFNYTTNNGSITITKYTGPGGAVIIPSEINGLPVTSIGFQAFYCCYSLTNVTIPNSVTNIEQNAFWACDNLTSANLGDGVKTIGNAAFFNCISLSSIRIPDSVTNLGGYMFVYCVSMTNVTIGKNVPNIAGNVFYECTSLTDITIPDGVGSIGDCAFYHNSNLTNITIPNSVTSIGGQAFNRCGLLTTFTIPEGVGSIGGYAFSHCTNLNEVTLPKSLTSIGYFAFSECTSLTNIDIPGSVTNIGNDVFWLCSNLVAINVDEPNSAYSSLGGVLFNKNQTALIQFPGGQTGSYIIPSSVTSIAEMAFYGCTNLTNIYFQGSPPSLGWAAFGKPDNTTATAYAYYLPGTIGWGATFGDLVTAQWVLPNPLILKNGPGFGMHTNGFGFTISWATNVPVVIDACTDLTHPAWTPIQTNTLTDGSAYFIDSDWTNHPTRIYRLRTP